MTTAHRLCKRDHSLGTTLRDDAIATQVSTTTIPAGFFHQIDALSGAIQINPAISFYLVRSRGAISPIQIPFFFSSSALAPRAHLDKTKRRMIVHSITHGVYHALSSTAARDNPVAITVLRVVFVSRSDAAPLADQPAGARTEEGGAPVLIFTGMGVFG